MYGTSFSWGLTELSEVPFLGSAFRENALDVCDPPKFGDILRILVGNIYTIGSEIVLGAVPV